MCSGLCLVLISLRDETEGVTPLRSTWNNLWRMARAGARLLRVVGTSLHAGGPLAHFVDGDDCCSTRRASGAIGSRPACPRPVAPGRATVTSAQRRPRVFFGPPPGARRFRDLAGGGQRTSQTREVTGSSGAVGCLSTIREFFARVFPFSAPTPPHFRG